MPNWLLQALAGIFGTALLAVTGFLIEQHSEIKLLRARVDLLEQRQVSRKEWQVGAEGVWNERGVTLAQMQARLEAMEADIQWMMEQYQAEYERLKRGQPVPQTP